MTAPYGETRSRAKMERMRARLLFAALVLIAPLAGCDPIVHVNGKVSATPVAAPAGHTIYVQAYRFPKLDASGMPTSAYGADVLLHDVYRGGPVSFQWHDLGRHTWRFLAWVDRDDSSASVPPAEARPSPGDSYGLSAEMDSTDVPEDLTLTIDRIAR